MWPVRLQAWGMTRDEAVDPSEYDNADAPLSEGAYLYVAARREAERRGDPAPPWGALGPYDGERYRRRGPRA